MATFYHVTSAANRSSIRRHGLDWRYGGGGIAGSLAPEQDGVFLARDRFEADFFVRMGKRRFDALDIWQVTLDEDDTGDQRQGIFVREFDGFLCWADAIPPSQLRLVEEDL
jgi:hypothetical protein